MKAHFVPRMYLREFIDRSTPKDREPWLWFADFETSKVGRRSVENFGRLADYYAFKDEAGEENQELEKMLGKTESFSRAIFDKLRSRPSAFSSDDRVKLC